MAKRSTKRGKTIDRGPLPVKAGSRFVSAVEAQEGRQLNEALIKQITGGVDLIKARFLHKEFFEFHPQFKIFLGTNHLPKIGMDDAVWERVHRVPFIVQIPKPERDKTLDTKLQAELPGILAWAVRGCMAWQQAGELHEPDPVKEATQGYKHEMDTIGRFLEERCILDSSVRVKMGALYAAYKKWGEDSGEHTGSLTNFGKRLDDQKFEKQVSNGTWRLGIGLFDTKGS